METIKKIEPVQIPGKGWNVRVITSLSTLWLTMGGPYTLEQAQTAAANLRRNAARHGDTPVLSGLLIGH